MLSKLKKLNSKFDEKALSSAKKIVDKYEVIMSCCNGEWYGRGLEIPTVFGDGKTPDECINNTKEALVATVAYLLEQGEAVPVPSSTGKRTEQVNIRLTAEEKAILSASAHSQGFKGLSDFLRAKVVSWSSVRPT